MPKYKIKLKGVDAMTVDAEYIAYEGPAVVLYDDFPHQPKRVIINWEAQIWLVDEG